MKTSLKWGQPCRLFSGPGGSWRGADSAGGGGAWPRPLIRPEMETSRPSSPVQKCSREVWRKGQSVERASSCTAASSTEYARWFWASRARFSRPRHSSRRVAALGRESAVLLGRGGEKSFSLKGGPR